MENEGFKQLCVWPGVTLDSETPTDLENFFSKKMGCTIKFAEEVVTNPDLDSAGKPVPDTGGRHDLLFWIADKDVSKFAVPRLSYGIRWWEDVVSYNKQSHLYSKEVLDRYSVTW